MSGAQPSQGAPPGGYRPGAEAPSKALPVSRGALGAALVAGIVGVVQTGLMLAARKNLAAIIKADGAWAQAHNQALEACDSVIRNVRDQ